MATSKDYYELLDVKRDASEEEIRRAYRKLARKFHPDVNKDPDASKRFSEITEAYDVLCDKDKRAAYDRFGHAGVGMGADSGAARARAGTGAEPGWSYSTTGGFDASDFSDIFEEVFGGRRTSPFGGGMGAEPTAGPRPRTATQRRRGRDIQHGLSISFQTAAFGGTERLRLSAANGGTEQIDVKIPAGIESGAKLRLKGRGEPGAYGGERGDLILTVKVGGHPYFRRKGLDLYLDVPINLAEAVLGTTVTVPLLQGTAELKIPAGTSSGQKMRLKGRGIRVPDGRTGDFYAVVQIIAPESLSENARSAIEDLSKELQNPRNSAPWSDDVKRASD